MVVFFCMGLLVGGASVVAVMNILPVI